MLGFGIAYKLEPGSYKLRIVTEGSLVVVLSIELDLDVWLALNKVVRPTGSSRCAARNESAISFTAASRGEILVRLGQVYAAQLPSLLLQ